MCVHVCICVHMIATMRACIFVTVCMHVCISI